MECSRDIDRSHLEMVHYSNDTFRYHKHDQQEGSNKTNT